LSLLLSIDLLLTIDRLLLLSTLRLLALAGPELGPVRRPGLPDRFFLGGATDVRGFAHRGIGPREGEDAMGGDCFYAAAAHLYTPLPVKALRDAAGAVRCHFFANAGGCAAIQPDASSTTRTRALVDGTAVAAGAGLAVRLAETVDIELNYCVPLRFGVSDRPWEGVQFGISFGVL